METTGRTRPTHPGVTTADTIVRGLYLLALLLALLLYGSVEVWPLTLAVTIMAGIGVAAILRFGEPAQAAVVFRAAVAFLILAVAWTFAQSAAWTGNPVGHPLWAEAERLLGPLPAAAAVSPETSRFGLLWFAMPLLSFVCALVLFPDDGSAVSLLRAVGIGGGAFAMLALGQFLAFPDMLMFEAKANYLDSLTAPFVNRNTAATFYGVICVVLFAWAYERAGTVLSDLRRDRPVAAAGRDPDWLPLLSDRTFLLAAGLLVASLCALFLTRSRAGVAATALAFLWLVPVLLAGPARAGRPRRGSGRRIAVAATGAAAVFVVTVLFAGRALFRLQKDGLSDARFCVMDGLVAAADANRLWGAGFGAFADVFAAYRDPACGIYRTWYRAHNGYLDLAIAMGLPFLLLALSLAVGLAIVYWRGLRTRISRRHHPATGLAVLILVGAHAAFDFSLQIPGFAAAAAAVLAATATVAGGRPARPRDGHDPGGGPSR